MKQHNVMTRNAILSKYQQDRAVFASAWKTDVLLTGKGWVVRGKCFIMPLCDSLEPEAANGFNFVARLGWLPPVVRKVLNKPVSASKIGIQRASGTKRSEAMHERLEEMVPNWLDILQSKVRFYCMQI